MTDINKFIFTRTQPQKKIEVINNLSQDELLRVSENTVLRIVKEVGNKSPHSRDKYLRINHSRRAGNGWNSNVDGIEYCKSKLFVSCYVQYSNTDTNTSEYYKEFFSHGEYTGSIESDDYYGNPRTYYFKYDSSDKARILKSILLEYVYTKYASKLNK